MNTHDDLPPIDFVLTPQDRDKAALAAVHLEAHRRRQNERDAMMALARWTGEQYRPRNGT
jgi:hypothetical protein